MQRKRTVISLVTVVGVAFGLSFSVGRASAAVVSVGEGVSVAPVDEGQFGDQPFETYDEGTFESEDEGSIESVDEPLDEEWIVDEGTLDEESEVEIGDAIAIERNADGVVTVPDLVALDEEARGDDASVEGVATQEVGASQVSTTTPPPTSVVSSAESELSPLELSSGHVRPIVQRQEPEAQQHQTTIGIAVAALLVAAGLVVSRGHLQARFARV